jgi:hypothetical protein
MNYVQLVLSHYLTRRAWSVLKQYIALGRK